MHIDTHSGIITGRTDDRRNNRMSDYDNPQSEKGRRVIEWPRKDYYLTNEIAEIFGVTSGRIRQYRTSGALQGTLIGNTVVHTPGELVRFALQERNVILRLID